MCNSCPYCPECGQMVAKPAGPNYLAGLLAPPVLMLWVASLGFHFEAVGPLIYGMLVGMAGLGAVMLVVTDPHPLRLRS